MLLNLTTLVRKYNLKIRGVIHIGAHHGQEINEYHSLGIGNMVMIEPCQAAYQHLTSCYLDRSDIRLFNVACGSKPGKAFMNVETANNGQSNSLLEPADHLRQYPDIKFHAKEEVNIVTLDMLANDFGDMYNFINSDCQGYEGEVFRGATNTLKNIDYIYTEVNRNEVYKGCIKVDELDELLSDYKRAETGEWVNKSWTDALYIKKSLI